MQVALHPSLAHMHRARGPGRIGAHGRGGYMRGLSRGYQHPVDYGYYPPQHYTDLPPHHHPDMTAGYQLGLGRGPQPQHVRSQQFAPAPLSSLGMDGGHGLASLGGMAPELLQAPGMQDVLMRDPLPPSSTLGLMVHPC